MVFWDDLYRDLQMVGPGPEAIVPPFQNAIIINVPAEKMTAENFALFFQWCEENCKGEWWHHYSNIDVWAFSQERDAMAFKLIWC